jgi:hypothetical protein
MSNNLFSFRSGSEADFDDDEADRHYELKKAALEKILGPMHELVIYAIIPFSLGGPVDLYVFPHALEGKAFATMELIQPDGTGPLPSNIGMYELVACTRLKIDINPKEVFEETERRIGRMLTAVAQAAVYEVFNPRDTCEIPTDEYRGPMCVVLDE